MIVRRRNPAFLALIIGVALISNGNCSGFYISGPKPINPKSKSLNLKSCVECGDHGHGRCGWVGMPIQKPKSKSINPF